jgi:hypothetical protein
MTRITHPFFSRGAITMLITMTIALLPMLVSAQGCTNNNKDEAAPQRELHLPSDAKPIAAASGDSQLRDSQLSFKAPEDGRVWVVDETDHRALTRHRLRAGQRFTLSPADDQATVDGRAVTDMQKLQIHPGHQYRLYFERE